MNTNNKKTYSIGIYRPEKDGLKTFLPNTFPGDFEFSGKLYKKQSEASHYLGKLDGITKLLPDKDFFLLMFIKKDATYSSQIEGTQATFQDAVAVGASSEYGAVDGSDVHDIVYYIKAVNYAMKRIVDFPLSLRLIREIHEKLMKGARSTQHAYPGEFRNSQNWIGTRLPKDASFIPPNVSDMKNALDELEKFIHAKDDFPALIKAGLLHAQFETIHPFTDGNGRTGRMLITLYLHKAGLLELPVLYLSSYFKKYQKLYYSKLASYHDEESDIEGWLNFFLDGVVDTAQSSIETCEKIIALREKDHAKIQTLGVKTASKTFEVLQQLYKQPIVGIADIENWTNYTQPGAYKMIQRLIDLDILEPLGDVKYGQKYIYTKYYKIFDSEFINKK
ncbi:MAG: Fic family protein [Candidatus Pacebacteria bacterium]|nr:Fic family protein [Candidatus Paceibacterota bacterium]